MTRDYRFNIASLYRDTFKIIGIIASDSMKSSRVLGSFALAFVSRMKLGRNKKRARQLVSSERGEAPYLEVTLLCYT